MLGILWLIIWATVGEAVNNDGRTLEFFTHSHEDFTSNLRKFASNYHRHRRDAEEDTMTLSQAKLKSEARRTCKNGQKRRIDSCNTCLCRNGFEICTKKNCQRTNRNAIVRSHNSEECKDGQQKEDNCNDCFCIDGAWICTQMKCENEKMKMVEHDPDIHECETGETKYDGCNHCYCNRGSWACTLILCTKMVNKNIEPKACIHGEQKKVDCNGCTCLRGVWSCTKKRCKKKPAQNRDTSDDTDGCIDGQQKQIDCNRCSCVNGLWACTRKSCMKKGKLLQSEARRTCKNGQKRRIDSCNTCLCRNGFEICTKKNCQRTNRNAIVRSHNSEECKDGQQKEDNCNDCFCIDGAWICTQMKCENEKMKMVEHDPDIHECETGETKYDGCNHCYCNRGSWACTLILCTKMVNKNIEPKACIHGEQKKVDCNGCTCLRGVWSCTKKRCKKKPAQNRDTSDDTDGCIDGQQKQIDCNRCSCVNGLWACTRKSCMKKGKLLPPEAERTCKLGDRFRLDKCNYCYCDHDKKLVCSHNTCYRTKTSLRKPMKSKCTTGDKYKIDECNHCHCTFNQRWKCTKNICPTSYDHILLQPGKKSCVTVRTYVHFTEPECEPGESIPAPDACNLCICLNSNIICTEYPCIERKLPGRSGPCTEGHKYYLEDGCNYCVCQDGLEYCTARACLSSTDESSSDVKCVEGEMTPQGDGCNMCVCNEGKRDCTNHECSNTRLRTGSSDTGEFEPYVSLRGKKRKKCIEGKTYVNREDDPSCPNKCICDNGELLCTNRQCGWGHGKGQFKGSSATHALSPSTKSVKRQFGACTENEDIPSGDSCTSCMCLHGQKICNRIHCPVMDVIWSSRFSDLDRHSNRARKHSRKGGKGIMEKEHVFCEPFTFYSPDNNRYCRNCFCLHNGLSLCLLNLCKYSKESLDPDCTPGETRTPTKCVACTCSDERKWVCVRQALAACQERDCDAKDEFHMGFLPYCAECKCSVKEWYCSIKSERCPGNTTCPIGTLIQNPKQHCSVCLCGGDSPGSHNMCFTEAKCVKQVISHLKN
uniref:Pacifastin domain-containing protein n=1 Tax=Heliothis virescens TaxID=7102 RepID=A0A2A4JYU6_HELVI